MRLLVTRPEPDATALAERLRRLGHTVLAQPLMTIAFAAEPVELPRPAAVLLTSRNAVRAISAWRAAKDWLELPVYAVGRGTGEAARASGFRDVRIGAGDGIALAEFVGRDRAGKEGTILYPAARDRAADLEALLAVLEVKTVEAYRGVAVDALAPEVAAAIHGRTLDGALFLSRRTAAIFAELVDEADVSAGLDVTTLFALSEEIAEELATLPARQTIVAARAEEDSLIAAIPSPVAAGGKGVL